MKQAESTGRLSSTRNFLSASWTAEVDAIERAMLRFEETHPLSTDCEVAFFEIATDPTLHVNVTHQHQTENIRGWAGPAERREGFVHNRTFGTIPTTEIVRHVRAMIFAGQA